MSVGVLAAGVAGAVAVLALWEGIAVLQGLKLSAAVLRAVAPVRSSVAGGRDVTAAERRRLIALLAATLGGAGLLIGGVWPALGAATTGPWVTGRALAWRRSRWRKSMADGAAAAARSLADALAGGHSVRGALTDVAQAGGTGPVADAELERARTGLALGATTEQVLETLRARADGPAWDTLVAAILLQREAGGDLAALLRQLADELDAACRVEADAHAATAQARFTAGIVAALPVLAATLAELMAPGTTVQITQSPMALLLGIGAVGLQLTGMLVVRRLARPVGG